MTQAPLPRDPAALAAALKDQGLPGQRSKTAITLLRAQRHARGCLPPPRSVRERLADRLASRYALEIAARGGETEIFTGGRPERLRVTSRHDGLVLLHASGWRQYAGQRSHRATLSYLCGHEDGQDWAVRVPGTITTVREALTWITPAEVQRARAAGRRVLRQGDVYAIETAKAHDGKGTLPERHAWDPGTRLLSHPEHPPLQLPYPVRFVPQRAYGMGRGAGHGQGYGD